MRACANDQRPSIKVIDPKERGGKQRSDPIIAKYRAHAEED